jgi:hypothetical protein
MIETYTHIPEKVEAVQYKYNKEEIIKWCGDQAWEDSYGLVLRTTQGVRLVFENDYIVKKDDKFYVYHPTAFERNYILDINN